MEWKSCTALRSTLSKNIDMKLCNEEMCEIYDALSKKSLLAQYRKLE